MADDRKAPTFTPLRAASGPRPSGDPWASEETDPAREVLDHEREVASHTRPVTPETSRVSSRPPPLPSAGMLPRTPAVPPHMTPRFDHPIEDSADERTPISITKPSLDLASAARGELGAHVVVMPTIDVGPDPLLDPLPAPALIAPSGPDIAPSSGPISSGRIPVSVAPPMPQIPKPISSRAPIVQAPGIVSTQAFPLTSPVKKPGRSPLFVAFAFAIIGSMLALAVALSLKGKKPDDTASAQEPPAQTASAAPSIDAPPAPIASAAPTVVAVTTAAPPPSATAPAPASSATSNSSAKPTAAPSPVRAPARKSDRIED